MELMQTDLPLPVAPAMRTWGILAISPTATPPVMSLPRAMVRGLEAFWKAGESSISRMLTIETTLLGTSMPMAGLPGMGASMRTPLAERFRAMSSASPVTLLIFPPAAGWSSYRVTAGPLETSMMRAWTPKLFRVFSKSSALLRSSLVVSVWETAGGSSKRFRGG